MVQFIGSLPLVVLIVFSGVSLIIGDLLAKIWSQNNNPYFFIFAILFYILYGLFFIPTLLKEQLVVSALAVVLINVIGFVFIGLVIFKESLNIYQIIGLILGVIAVILLER